ncbi:MAG: nuclear transport factor 2 family protein [Myxococcota bacterium]
MDRWIAVGCLIGLGCVGHAPVAPAAGAGVVVAAAPAVDVAAERAAVLAAEASWAEAVANHDVERVLAFFAPDGLSLPPDAPMVQGDGPRREYLTALFGEPEFDSGWETTRVDISAAGDMALSVGTTTHFAGHAPDGSTLTERGKYVTVWVKVGGEWKVAADMWNSTAIGPAPAP